MRKYRNLSEKIIDFGKRIRTLKSLRKPKNYSTQVHKKYSNHPSYDYLGSDIQHLKYYARCHNVALGLLRGHPYSRIEKPRQDNKICRSGVLDVLTTFVGDEDAKEIVRNLP